MSPARANRVKLIRTRAAAGALAVFMAVWGVIGVQLASGNDPALSNASGSTTSTTATTSTASDSTTDTQSQVESSGQSSTSVGPVTTSQS
jgi:hypothetical protein